MIDQIAAKRRRHRSGLSLRPAFQNDDPNPDALLATAAVTIFIAEPGIMSLSGVERDRSSSEIARGLISTLQNERSNCGVVKIAPRSVPRLETGVATAAGATAGATVTDFDAPQSAAASAARTARVSLTPSCYGNASSFLMRLLELAGFELQRAWLICARREGTSSGGAERHAFLLFAIIELHRDDSGGTRVAGGCACAVDEAFRPQVREIKQRALEIAGIDCLLSRCDLFPGIHGIFARSLHTLERPRVFAASNLETCRVERPEIKHFLSAQILRFLLQLFGDAVVDAEDRGP